MANKYTPVIRPFTQDPDPIALDQVASFTIKNVGADRIFYNINEEAINEDIVIESGDEESWSAGDNGEYTGAQLYIKFEDSLTSKKCLLKMNVKGAEIIKPSSEC